MNKSLIELKKHFVKILAGLALAGALVSCGVVAFTGRRQMLLFSDSEITSLSDQSYAEFMSTAQVSNRAADTKTLTTVGKKMTAALESYLNSTGQANVMKDLKWEFSLVKSNEINAFCLPSGKIVFYEGILGVANTPDYIAVVMGHEMAHAIAKHGNERMSQQAAMNMIGGVASEIIGAKTGKTAQALFNVGFNVGSQYGCLLPYSRKHEYEADRIGLYLMAIAGYDINAAPTFWQKMTEGKQNPNANDFFSTHPSDSKRIEALRNAIKDAEKYKK